MKQEDRIKQFEKQLEEISWLRGAVAFEIKKSQEKENSESNISSLGLLIMVEDDIRRDFADLLRMTPYTLLLEIEIDDQSSNELVKLVAEHVATKLVNAGIEEVFDLTKHLKTPAYDRDTWIRFIKDGREKLKEHKKLSVLIAVF